MGRRFGQQIDRPHVPLWAVVCGAEASISRLATASEEASLGHRNATMIVGLILALGMGGLLLVWLNLNEGSGIVGLLFIFGVVAGLVAVLAGALSGSDQD
jgi:preprotein translocase subunit SecY